LYFFAFGVGIDSHFANTPTIDLFDQRPDDFVFAAGHAGSSWFDPIARDQHHVGVFRIDLLGFADFKRGIRRTDWRNL
jgi:hypothetical protein